MAHCERRGGRRPVQRPTCLAAGKQQVGPTTAPMPDTPSRNALKVYPVKCQPEAARQREIVRCNVTHAHASTAVALHARCACFPPRACGLLDSSGVRLSVVSHLPPPLFSGAPSLPDAAFAYASLRPLSAHMLSYRRLMFSARRLRVLCSSMSPVTL